MLHCGDTLFMRLGIPEEIPHLWIIITEPGIDERCAMVSVTTLRGDKDQTVTLGRGDHPYIHHPSVISFIDAQLGYVSALESLIAGHVAERRERFSDEIMKLICEGLLGSPHTPNRIVDFCRDLWGLPPRRHFPRPLPEKPKGRRRK